MTKTSQANPTETIYLIFCFVLGQHMANAPFFSFHFRTCKYGSIYSNGEYTQIALLQLIIDIRHCILDRVRSIQEYIHSSISKLLVGETFLRKYVCKSKEKYKKHSCKIVCFRMICIGQCRNPNLLCRNNSRFFQPRLCVSSLQGMNWRN